MMTIPGIVRNGAIVLDQALPEGTKVYIVVEDPVPEIPPDLQAEMAAWGRASDRALEKVERLAWQDSASGKG